MEIAFINIDGSTRLPCPTGSDLVRRCPIIAILCSIPPPLRLHRAPPSLRLHRGHLGPSALWFHFGHSSPGLVSPSFSVTDSLSPSDIAWASRSPCVTSVGRAQWTTLAPPSITSTMGRLYRGHLLGHFGISSAVRSLDLTNFHSSMGPSTVISSMAPPIIISSLVFFFCLFAFTSPLPALLTSPSPPPHPPQKKPTIPTTHVLKDNKARRHGDKDNKTRQIRLKS